MIKINYLKLNITEKLNNKIDMLFILTFFLLFFYTSLALILKYFNFDYHAFDAGIQARVARQAIFKGNFYEEVLKLNFLGIHFSPILAVIGVLFLLWDNLLILILFKNSCIFLAAYIGYKISNLIFKNKIYSIILFFLFIINNYTTNIALFEYHIESIAMPIYMYMFYLLESKDTKTNKIFFVILGMMGVLIKEDVIIAMAVIGLWTVFFKKNYLREGLFIFVFNIVSFIMVVEIIMPFFLKGEQMIHIYRYAHLGNSFFDIVKTIIFKPIDFLNHLFNPIIKLKKLIDLIEDSFLFLPIFSPMKFLLSIPMIIFNMITSYAPQYEFCCQYTISIIPQLFYASLFGLKNILTFLENRIKSEKVIRGFILLLLFVMITLNNDFRNFINRYKHYYNFNIEKYNEFIKNVKPLLNKNARIYTDEQLYPYIFEYNIGCIRKYDIIPADAELFVFAFQTGYNWSWDCKEHRDFVNMLTQKFAIIYKSNNFLILKP